MYVYLISQAAKAAPSTEVPAEVGEVLDNLSLFLDAISSQAPNILLGVVAALAMVGSAAIASSIAESRLRSRDLHFIIGFFIPIVYPALAFVALPKRKYKRKGDGDEAISTGKHNAGAPPVAGPKLPPAPEKDTGKDTFSTMGQAYDVSFFKTLLFDETGNPRGPFILTIDNVEVRVERILDAMPEVAILETINSDGKQQTLRVPYGRVGACREL